VTPSVLDSRVYTHQNYKHSPTPPSQPITWRLGRFTTAISSYLQELGPVHEVSISTHSPSLLQSNPLSPSGARLPQRVPGSHSVSSSNLKQVWGGTSLTAAVGIYMVRLRTILLTPSRSWIGPLSSGDGTNLVKNAVLSLVGASLYNVQRLENQRNIHTFKKHGFFIEHTPEKLRPW
jgi:hypothetical protein